MSLLKAKMKNFLSRLHMCMCMCVEGAEYGRPFEPVVVLLRGFGGRLEKSVGIESRLSFELLLLRISVEVMR